MTDEYIRAHVRKVLLCRLDRNQERRSEALGDFLALNLPGSDERFTRAVAALVPALPQSLYEKWIGLFAERLLETIPRGQLEDLCDGTQDNDATISLVYLLFMESARMEKQIARDLAALGLQTRPGEPNEALADALALYLKARLGQKTWK